MTSIHGILVQLPLPPHISVAHVVERISVEKDVDGFHLYNVGGLVTGNTVFSPCTPYGVQKILEYEKIPVEGRNVVVVGASNHRRQADRADADAAGRDGLHLPQEDARPRAVHAAGRHSRRRGRRSQPDRAADGANRRGRDRRGLSTACRTAGSSATSISKASKQKASYITPVPGGVGQMTVTMLLHNTILSAERKVADVTSPFLRNGSG